MRLRLSPLKLFNWLAFLALLSAFIFLPMAPKVGQPAVESATATRLYLPRTIASLTPAPDLTAQAVYIFDPDSGTVIYEKNSRQRTYPASTTKLMTALVAMKTYELDQVLTVNSGEGATGQTIDLAKGDQLTVESLLYGLLIDSGNDAAVTLAENYPGGYGQFIAAMNEAALRLGLTDTHFTNVAGFENPDHYTTARDLTYLAREAIKNAFIRKAVSTKEITFYDITGLKKFSFTSTNKLLGLPGVKGLKTGWTPASGECLVTLVTRDGKSIIVTLLNSTDRFGESIELIDWVYANYIWETI